MSLNVFDLADYSPVILTSFASGIYLHLAIGPTNLEFERYTLHSLGLAVVAYISSLVVLTQRIGYHLPHALAQTSIAYASFFTGVLISLSIYRLYFHRCRHFPGPRLAALSKFYLAYKNANLNDTQYYQELEKLHKIYGDYVRIGPRDISILNKEAIPLIYGPKAECKKGTWYTQTGWNPDDVHIGSIRDTAKYKQRRRIWERGLSTRMFPLYEPRIKAKADVLIAQLKARAGHAVDSTAWSMFFSFDVMGEVSFGRDFDNLASGTEHPCIRVMHGLILLLGVFSVVPWLMNVLGAMPGAARAMKEYEGICLGVLRKKEETWDSEGAREPDDMISWFLKAIRDGDAGAAPTRKALEEDTRSVVMAGSDTTANALANALFYLAKHTDVQRKLQRLLDDAMPGGYPTWNYRAVKTVPFLDDIINETLRLKPPIIQGVPRETPPEGLRIGTTYIPGHTNVLVPLISIQRDPRYWAQPTSFVPERWTERREEMHFEEGEDTWMPFQRGLHRCAGKDLAYLTLRTALSAIVQNFDVGFSGEESEGSLRAFDERFLSSLLMTLRPLRLVFRTRER